MNILVTGAKGFVGKNLVQNLLNIKDGKNQTRKVHIDEVLHGHPPDEDKPSG